MKMILLNNTLYWVSIKSVCVSLAIVYALTLLKFLILENSAHRLCSSKLRNLLKEKKSKTKSWSHNFTSTKNSYLDSHKYFCKNYKVWSFEPFEDIFNSGPSPLLWPLNMRFTQLRGSSVVRFNGSVYVIRNATFSTAWLWIIMDAAVRQPRIGHW